MDVFDPGLYPKDLIAGLTTAFTSGRFPHTLLIHGPKGVGKQSLAFQIAKTLLCSESASKPLESCSCVSCQKISGDTHPDLKFFENEDEATIKVAQIRELLSWMRFRPFESEKKVLIVQGAERLVDEALNAFLKMLEEPPESSTVILLSEMPSKLKPTLISRCFQIALRPLSTSRLEELLLSKGVVADEARYLSLISKGIWQDAERRLGEEDFRADDNRLKELLSHYSYELVEENLGRSAQRMTPEKKRELS